MIIGSVRSVDARRRPGPRGHVDRRRPGGARRHPGRGAADVVPRRVLRRPRVPRTRRRRRPVPGDGDEITETETERDIESAGRAGGRGDRRRSPATTSPGSSRPAPMAIGGRGETINAAVDGAAEILGVLGDQQAVLGAAIDDVAALGEARGPAQRRHRRPHRRPGRRHRRRSAAAATGWSTPSRRSSAWPAPPPRWCWSRTPSGLAQTLAELDPLLGDLTGRTDVLGRLIVDFRRFTEVLPTRRAQRPDPHPGLGVRRRRPRWDWRRRPRPRRRAG